MRYQAALRPDMIITIDSKALSNFMTTPNHDFWPSGVNPFSETGFLGACEQELNFRQLSGANGRNIVERYSMTLIVKAQNRL